MPAVVPVTPTLTATPFSGVPELASLTRPLRVPSRPSVSLSLIVTVALDGAPSSPLVGVPRVTVRVSTSGSSSNTSSRTWMSMFALVAPAAIVTGETVTTLKSSAPAVPRVTVKGTLMASLKPLDSTTERTRVPPSPTAPAGACRVTVGGVAETPSTLLP